MAFTINIENKPNMIGSPYITEQAMSILNNMNYPIIFVHEEHTGINDQMWTLYITIQRVDGTEKTFEYLREVILSHGDIQSEIPYFLEYDTEFGLAYETNNPLEILPFEDDELPIPENTMYHIKKRSSGR